MRRAPLLALFLLVVGLVAGGQATTRASVPSTLDRPYDPVVLIGADVPSLLGFDPSDIVAFKYDDGWEQIPVQVDERGVVEFSQVYNGGPGAGSSRSSTPILTPSRVRTAT